MSLLAAIDTLVAAVDAGMTAKPKEGTTAWWLLRCNSTSLSMLRAIKARELSIVQAEEFRKRLRLYMQDPEKTLEPDAEIVVTVPTGIESE